MATLSKGLREAYEVQDATHQAILQLKSVPDSMSITKALAFAQLVTAFDRIQARIRIHRRGAGLHKRKPRVRRVPRTNGERRAWQPLAGAKPTAAVAPGPEASGVKAGGIESSSQSPEH